MDIMISNHKRKDDMINWQKIKSEAADLLGDLIRIDTSNPPGNEAKGIDYIRKVVRSYDFDIETLETAPGRSNLLISYNGTYKNPLILLSHIDVVPADGKDWQHSPFAGEVVDDVMYGRGAIDTKHLIVMQMLVMMLLKRERHILDRDLVMIVTADEEAGSEYGLLKVLEQRSNLFQNADVISEGGGFPVLVNESPHYLVETGQKGLCRLRFKITESENNPSFFASNGHIYQSAMLVEKLNFIDWNEEIPVTTAKLIKGLVGSVSHESYDESKPVNDQLNILKEAVSPFLYTLLKAMTKTTFSVTKWKAGVQGKTANTVDIEVDGRILPGMKKENVIDRVQRAVGDDVDWEVIDFSEGYESIYQNKLFKYMQTTLEQKVPGSKTVPFISTGSSDGRHLRSYQSNVYGFSPVLPDMSFEKVLPLVHGVDERISLDSLLFGTKIMYSVMKKYYGRERL